MISLLFFSVRRIVVNAAYAAFTLCAFCKTILKFATLWLKIVYSVSHIVADAACAVSLRSVRFAIGALLRIRLHGLLLTTLPTRFICHRQRSSPRSALCGFCMTNF